MNALFASIPDTQVVLMAGNHDYLKKGSYYLSFSWAENVTGLFGETCERVDFPENFRWRCMDVATTAVR